VFPHRPRPLTLPHPADVIRAVCFVGRTYFRISRISFRVVFVRVRSRIRVVFVCVCIVFACVRSRIRIVFVRVCIVFACVCIVFACVCIVFVRVCMSRHCSASSDAKKARSLRQ